MQSTKNKKMFFGAWVKKRLHRHTVEDARTVHVYFSRLIFVGPSLTECLLVVFLFFYFNSITQLGKLTINYSIGRSHS